MELRIKSKIKVEEITIQHFELDEGLATVRCSIHPFGKISSGYNPNFTIITKLGGKAWQELKALIEDEGRIKMSINAEEIIDKLIESIEQRNKFFGQQQELEEKHCQRQLQQLRDEFEKEKRTYEVDANLKDKQNVNHIDNLSMVVNEKQRSIEKSRKDVASAIENTSTWMIRCAKAEKEKEKFEVAMKLWKNKYLTILKYSERVLTKQQFKNLDRKLNK